MPLMSGLLELDQCGLGHILLFLLFLSDKYPYENQRLQ